MTDESTRRVVWKFPLPDQPIFELQLPYLARPLCIRDVADKPVVYFLVNPSNPLYPRRLQIVLTGAPMVEPDTDWDYIGTVGHLYIEHVFISRYSART